MSYVLQRDTRPLTATVPNLESWLPNIPREDAAAAVATIGAWGKQHFGNAITMQTTPNHFGMQLILHTLPEGRQYPTVTDGIQRLLYAVSFPLRLEKFAPIKNATHAYDCRVAYLAHTRSVPVYTPETFTHDEKPCYEPYRRGWYLAVVTVPTGWKHIGLVPSEERVGTSRKYPYTPGHTFQTWLTDSEMQLLKDFSWGFSVKKRVLFATSSTPGSDPLRTWHDHLAGGIESLDRIIAGNEEMKWKLVRTALRNVAIYTIGQFNVSDKLHSDGFDQETGMLKWKQHIMTSFSERWQHPEWGANIWSRTRVQATRIALQFKREQLVEIRGDEVFTTTPMIGHEDTGRVGGYREKRVLQHA